jgi:uncharacterized membrane protein
VTPEEGSAVSRRLRWIDLLRGIAILLMIAAHVADAFLSDAFRRGPLWNGVNGLFGFVAPGFLLLSGVAVWISLSRQDGDRLASGAAASKLGRRSVQFLLLGYWLQIPILSLRQLVYCRRPAELARLFDANILQEIALGILSILGVAWLLRRFSGSRSLLATIFALVALAIVAATPYVWGSGIYLSVPLPLAAYLAPHPPALFPLFPYLAYSLAGFALAPILVGWGSSRRGWAMALAAGLLAMIAALALDPILRPLAPFRDFWGSSPLHFLFRGGGVVAGASVAMIAAGALQPRHTGWLEYIGRRSLGIYVVHLMLVYGSPVNMGLRYWLHGALNRTLDPLAAVAIFASVALLACLAIGGWEQLKRGYPATARWARRLWWGIFWAFFLLRP